MAGEQVSELQRLMGGSLGIKTKLYKMKEGTTMKSVLQSAVNSELNKMGNRFLERRISQHPGTKFIFKLGNGAKSVVFSRLSAKPTSNLLFVRL